MLKMRAPTVFIVDDHAAVRLALGEMLSVYGYTTELYESADAFLKSVDAAPPGCVVADVRMPGTVGIQLVRELTRRGRFIPVILISGHADVPMAVAGIKAGAEDFIEKPVDDAQLVAAINRCFSQAFDQLAQQRSVSELRVHFTQLPPPRVGSISAGRARLYQPCDRGTAQYQSANRRELSRPDHGQNAGRERRRTRAPSHSPRRDLSVDLPPNRCE